MIEPEYSKTYFGSALILFQGLKRHLFSILLQLLARFIEAVDSTSEAVAVLGAAVLEMQWRIAKVPSRQQPGTAVAFCPYQVRHTVQFVPYLFSIAAIFFRAASELFRRLQGVKCKCTISLTIQEAT